MPFGLSDVQITEYSSNYPEWKLSRSSWCDSAKKTEKHTHIMEEILIRAFPPVRCVISRWLIDLESTPYGYCVELQAKMGEGREGEKRTTKERREVRESETETERREQKRCKDLESQMVPCGLDFSCQSSVVWENQSPQSSPWLPLSPSLCFSFTTPSSFLSSPFPPLHFFFPTKIIISYPISLLTLFLTTSSS